MHLEPLSHKAQNKITGVTKAGVTIAAVQLKLQLRPAGRPEPQTGRGSQRLPPFLRSLIALQAHNNVTATRLHSASFHWQT